MLNQIILIQFSYINEETLQILSVRGDLYPWKIKNLDTFIVSRIINFNVLEEQKGYIRPIFP